jgi:hypothetical protein
METKKRSDSRAVDGSKPALFQLKEYMITGKAAISQAFQRARDGDGRTSVRCHPRLLSSSDRLA